MTALRLLSAVGCLTVVLVACGPGSGTSATGSETGGGSQGTGGVTDAATGTGTGGVTDAPTGGGGACAVGGECTPDPVDCNVQSCGDPFSIFGEDGCPRVHCSFGSCPEGQVCFDAVEYGRCVGGLVCFDDPGGCVCSEDDGCGDKLCVPAGSVPSERCADLTDEAACVAAGCTALVPFRDISDDCECAPQGMRCVWGPAPLTGPEQPTVYYREFEFTAAVFAQTFAVPPFGWTQCTGDPENVDEANACKCALQADPCVPAP